MDLMTASLLSLMCASLCLGMPRIYSRLDDVPNKRYGKFAVIGKPIVFTNPDNNIDIFRNHPSVLKVLDVRSRRVNKNEMDYNMNGVQNEKRAYYPLPNFRVGRDVDHVDPVLDDDIAFSEHE